MCCPKCNPGQIELKGYDKKDSRRSIMVTKDVSEKETIKVGVSFVLNSIPLIFFFQISKLSTTVGTLLFR